MVPLADISQFPNRHLDLHSTSV